MVLPAAPCTISMAAKRVRGAAAVLRSGSLRGHHGIEQRQRQTYAQTAQQRAAGKMLLSDEHLAESFRLCETLESAGAASSACRIWKGALSTIAMNESGEAVVVLRRLAVDGPHHRHVVVFDAAAQRVGQQLFGKVRMKESECATSAWRRLMGPSTLVPSNSLPVASISEPLS